MYRVYISTWCDITVYDTSKNLLVPTPGCNQMQFTVLINVDSIFFSALVHFANGIIYIVTLDYQLAAHSIHPRRRNAVGSRWRLAQCVKIFAGMPSRIKELFIYLPAFPNLLLSKIINVIVNIQGHIRDRGHIPAFRIIVIVARTAANVTGNVNLPNIGE